MKKKKQPSIKWLRVKIAAEEADMYMWMDPLSTSKGSDKKRRFSEEKVMSLELMFEIQMKREPRKKLQIAKELGLHPSQVAMVPKQESKRESKQLEREYNALRADYDAMFVRNGLWPVDWKVPLGFKVHGSLLA